MSPLSLESPCPRSRWEIIIAAVAGGQQPGQQNNCSQDAPFPPHAAFVFSAPGWTESIHGRSWKEFVKHHESWTMAWNQKCVEACDYLILRYFLSSSVHQLSACQWRFVFSPFIDDVKLCLCWLSRWRFLGLPAPAVWYAACCGPRLLTRTCSVAARGAGTTAQSSVGSPTVNMYVGSSLVTS